jgi:hypothetical protein
MWDWINCHLLGRHEQAVSCDSGSVHLRCLRCGQRSSGWQVDRREMVLLPARPAPRRPALHLIARRQE